MRRAARLVQKWAPAVACARDGKGSAEGTLDAQLPLEGEEHNFRPLNHTLGCRDGSGGSETARGREQHLEREKTRQR